MVCLKLLILYNILELNCAVLFWCLHCMSVWCMPLFFKIFSCKFWEKIEDGKRDCINIICWTFSYTARKGMGHKWLKSWYIVRITGLGCAPQFVFIFSLPVEIIFIFFTFGSTPLCTTFIGLNLGFHAESQTPMLSLLFILLQGFFLLEACCQTSRGASGVQGWLHWRTLNFLSLQHQRLMSLSPFLLQDVVPSKDQRIRLLYVATWYLSL